MRVRSCATSCWAAAASASRIVPGNHDLWRGMGLGRLQGREPGLSSTPTPRPAAISSTPPTSTPAAPARRLVGQFVGKDRERFVIATEILRSVRQGDPNACGNHRKSFFDALHASLKRLSTSYIDLYWLHAWDGLTPVDEINGRAFDDAVRQGKILYAGISMPRPGSSLRRTLLPT